MSQKVLNAESNNKQLINSPKQPPPNNNAASRLQKQSKTQNQKSPSTNPQQKSSIQQIQSQKSTIVHQLRRINQTIDQLREDQRSKSILRKRQEIANDRKARRQALSFVAKQKIKKQEMLECHLQYEEINRALLKKQVEENKKRRQQYQSMLREQKQRTIRIRMNHSKSRREQLKNIHKQSDCLIKKLVRQELSLCKKTQFTDHSFEKNMKVIQRRPQVDFAAVNKHEQEYLKRKEQLSSNKKQRTNSISHPVKRFQKNRWAQKLQEEANKAKEQERLKQIDRRIRLQKKTKYGQMINSLFVTKHRSAQAEGPQTKKKSKSKSIYVTRLSKVPSSVKMKTQKSQNLQSKSLRLKKKLINSHYTSIRKEDRHKSPQDKLRQEKERKIRRQTSQRLRKMDSQILQKTASEPQSKYQSNFQNYLGQAKLKKGKPWNSILSNSQLTNAQKFVLLMRNASSLQNKAKLKEHSKEKSDAIELYLGSIQVKLAILKGI